MPTKSYDSLATHKPNKEVSNKLTFHKCLSIILFTLVFVLVAAYFLKPYLSKNLNAPSSTSGTPSLEKERTLQEQKYESILSDFPYTGTSGVKSFSNTDERVALVLTGQLINVTDAYLTLSYPSPSTSQNIEILYGDALTLRKSALNALIPGTDTNNTQVVLNAFIGSFVEIQADVTQDGFLEARSFDFASFRDIPLDNLTTEY